MISMRMLILSYTIQEVILNFVPTFKILDAVHFVVLEKSLKEKSLHTDTQRDNTKTITHYTSYAGGIMNPYTMCCIKQIKVHGLPSEDYKIREGIK